MKTIVNTRARQSTRCRQHSNSPGQPVPVPPGSAHSLDRKISCFFHAIRKLRKCQQRLQRHTRIQEENTKDQTHRFVYNKEEKEENIFLISGLSFCTKI